MPDLAGMDDRRLWEMIERDVREIAKRSETDHELLLEIKFSQKAHAEQLAAHALKIALMEKDLDDLKSSSDVAKGAEMPLRVKELDTRLTKIERLKERAIGAQMALASIGGIVGAAILEAIHWMTREHK